MAALGSPARTLRGLLRELRYMNAATGRPYRDTAAYRYLVKAFRAHRVRKPVSGSSVPSREGRESRVWGACISEASPSTQPPFRPSKPRLSALVCGLSPGPDQGPAGEHSRPGLAPSPGISLAGLCMCRRKVREREMGEKKNGALGGECRVTSHSICPAFPSPFP